MNDREPTHPGRVRLSPVSGQENVFDMTMEDDPTIAGDAPVKRNLLRDATAEMLGLPKTAVVNDAFVVIAQSLKLITSGSAVLNLTVVDNNGLPVKGVLVAGLFDAAGGQLYTDDNGIANGIIPANGATISITGYADLQDYSEEISIVQGGTEDKTVTLTRVSVRELTASAQLVLSKNVVLFDVCLCGAGGGSGYASQGANMFQNIGSRGGGGGYVINLYDLNPNDGTYYITVGVGGRGADRNAGTDATSGGYTELTRDGVSIGVAMGGVGSSNASRTGTLPLVAGRVGEGNGRGGYAFQGNSSGNNLASERGVSGSVRVFDDPGGILPGGGGAGGSMDNFADGQGDDPKIGGSGYGGKSGESGKTPGGGAGGQITGIAGFYRGLKGGNGKAWVRMEVS